MSIDPQPDEQAVTAAREEFRVAYRRVVETIHAVAAPRQAFALATEFRDEIAELEEDAATLRAVQVRRIRDDEALDLAKLGASLPGSPTKQRVGKMISRAAGAVAPTPEG